MLISQSLPGNSVHLGGPCVKISNCHDGHGTISRYKSWDLTSARLRFQKAQPENLPCVWGFYTVNSHQRSTLSSLLSPLLAPPPRVPVPLASQSGLSWALGGHVTVQHSGAKRCLSCGFCQKTALYSGLVISCTHCILELGYMLWRGVLDTLGKVNFNIWADDVTCPESIRTKEKSPGARKFL